MKKASTVAFSAMLAMISSSSASILGKETLRTDAYDVPGDGAVA